MPAIIYSERINQTETIPGVTLHTNSWRENYEPHRISYWARGSSVWVEP